MWFRNLLIRKKFIVSFSILLALGFAGALIGYFTFSRIDDFQQLRNSTSKIILDLNQTQKKQKEFLLYGWKQEAFLEDGKSAETLAIDQDLHRIRLQLNKLIESDEVSSNDIKRDFHLLNTFVGNYRSTFGELVQLLHKRGFKNHGLEGEMRNYAHDLQERASYEEQVYALSLRKHEKDFALRHDLKYVDRLQETADTFSHFISNASIQKYPHMTDPYKEQTIADIAAYVKHFNTIVQTEIEIGLDQGNGKLLELENLLSKTKPLVEAIYSNIEAINNELRRRAFIIMLITAPVLIVGSLFLIFLLRKTVSKPIIKLDETVRKVLHEDLTISEEWELQSKDEIGSLSRNFKSMLIKLRENMQLIQEKNLSLEETARLDKLHQWRNEGLAKFSQVMKTSEGDLEEFSKILISEIVKFMHASQGALFVKETSSHDNQEALNLKGSYAFDRNKYFKKSVEKGEGLIGQCWIEMDTIYLTDIPDNFINIRSGLGGAAPSSVLIIPMIHQDKVKGVIELASFHEFNSVEKEFLGELGSRIAASISSMQMQIKTTTLLSESQEMMEQLRSQEEEMRQNMEELESTQEEMERSQRLLNKRLHISEHARERVNQLLGKLYDGFIIVNEKGKILEVNKKVLNLLSADPSEMIDQSINQLPEIQLGDLFQKIENDPQFHASGRSEVYQIKLLTHTHDFQSFECDVLRFYHEEEKL